MKNKRKTKQTQKVIKKEHNKDILGIIIISLGIIVLVSLFSLKMGIIGQILNGTTFNLMGFGGYFSPILIVSIGLILILDKYNKLESKAILAAIIMFLSFLVILDGINQVDASLLERIKNGFTLSQLNKGGGIIGSFFGFFFYKLFGSTGTYIVITVLLLISLLIITNSKVKDVIEKANQIKPIKPIRIQEVEKKERKKPQISPEVYLELPPEEIKIQEHNKPVKEVLDIVDLKKGSTKIESEIKEKQIKVSNLKYKVPPLSLLNSVANKSGGDDRKEILSNGEKITETMRNFGIEATITGISKGPTITCYELSPAPGIKLSKIVSLSDNIALSLASSDIRIEAPIPGKAAVGIEVPNRVKDAVFLKEIIQSEEYRKLDSPIPLALGKDVSGKPIVSTIDKMPHLLIAGATGSGKSVCINTIIMNILYRSSPDDVKLLLIDPKVVELSVYNGIPHLLIPVVTDAKKSAFALNWAVTEMERRYKLFAQNSVRDISSYNSKNINTSEEKLPMIVIIIDELADLMMVASQEIEDYICRLAQMARAAGMYLIVATQRPSVDVITGTIKANIPSRISFSVSSQIDSRTILDMAGAEKLLGKGDMLFYPSFYSKPLRLQGAFISEAEVERVVSYLKEQNITEYDEDIIEVVENVKDIDYDDSDELLPEAIKLVVEEGQASISLLQRRLRVGYARAARIVDEMEARGIIGGYEGSKPRKVLMSKEELSDEE